MKIEKLLKRLKIEFFKVNLIQASLDAILFFLSINLVLFLINQRILGTVENYVITGPLTGLFFLGDLVYRIRNYHLEIYEEKNPEFKEVLRTARDNIDKSNIASQALFDDLMKRARNVTSESIIPSKSIIKKILVIGALSLLTVLSGLADFHIQENQFSLVDDLGIVNEDSGTDNSTNQPKVLNGSKIFGEPAEIKSSNRDFQFNISGSGESSKREFSFDVASEEFALEASRQQSPENLNLAKKYSLAIKNMN